MEQNLSLGPCGPDHAEQKPEVTQSWGWGVGGSAWEDKSCDIC